jgi:hypothetical protein
MIGFYDKLTKKTIYYEIKKQGKFYFKYLYNYIFIKKLCKSINRRSD